MLKKSILLIVFLSYQLFGTANRGTSAANFLKIGVGGRAAGMGEAFSAVSDDPSALFFNPGGVAQIDEIEILFSYNKWIFDTYLNFAGVVFPLGRFGSLGISLYSFSSGEIKETNMFQPGGTGRDFTTGNMAVCMSYARALTDRFMVGGTFKHVEAHVSEYRAGTFAFDIGSIFRTNVLNEMTIAFVLSNFGGKICYGGGALYSQATEQIETFPAEWNLPLCFRIGLSSYLLKRNEVSLRWAFDVNDSRDCERRETIGMEFAFRDMMYLRAGYKFGYNEETLTAGAGFKLGIPDVGKVTIDYAYIDMNRLNVSHRISLRIEYLRK